MAKLNQNLEGKGAIYAVHEGQPPGDRVGWRRVITEGQMEDIQEICEQFIPSEEHGKRCTITLVIREILNRTKIGFYFKTIILVIVKK